MDAPVALVAGASRGLGLLIARELLARGHSVVICARDGAELDDAARLLDPSGHRVLTRVCDVADQDAVEAMVRWTEDEVGPIEVAIHVAGIIQVLPLENTRVEHYEEALAVMTLGPVHLAMAVLPGMRGRGHGRIGTVASIGGAVSVPHLLPYSTAKFGAVGFARAGCPPSSPAPASPRPRSSPASCAPARTSTRSSAATRPRSTRGSPPAPPFRSSR